MGVICLTGKELDPDEKAAKDTEKNMEEFKQESDRDITISELEMEFEKISKKLPLTLDAICGNRSNRCWLDSCPCGSDHDLASFVSLLNSIKNHGWHSIYSGEYKGSFSLNLVNKALSLLNSPSNLRLPEFIFEDLINERKIRSLNDPPGSSLYERSVTYTLGNSVLRNSGRWKLDAFQENVKAISLLKRLQFANLNLLDDAIDQPRSRSPNHTMWATSDSSKSPLSDGDRSLRKSKSDLNPVEKEASEVKFPKLKISHPSSSSTFSWQSTSPANSFITKGQLQCIQKGKMPYFIFSVDDDACRAIYMATPLKIESYAEKAIDSLYSFYIKDSKSSDPRKHSRNSTSLIAKMKVSSSIVLKPNRAKIMETEFVLYGCQEELSNKLRNSSSAVSGSNVLPRKISEIFRQNNMGKIKPKDKAYEQMFDGLEDINESDLATDAFDLLLPNLELAAIVVEESFHDTTNDLMSGGWGLKFLEKGSRKDASSKAHLAPCSSKNPSYRDESERSMNVIIPADLHSGPVARHGGPASVISRWRSGGRCDCGGWDIGCPLTVLSHSSIGSSGSAKEVEKKPVNLFIEGTKNRGNPTLTLLKIAEGLYSICFQSSLSVLQSFSIAVAAIHKNC